MKHLLPAFSALAVCLCLFTVSFSRAEVKSFAPAWPHEDSDLKPDPAITWGALPNGLRYAIMPNMEQGADGKPVPKVSLRIYVDTGSLMEEDTQQGLAHFLEHMAFNGTKHFSAEETVKFFNRMGMSFGGDTNAHTGFMETVYMLEIPHNTKEDIEKGLLFFRDVAGEMLLGEKEIEKERGVILSEKLARDDVDFRTMVEGFKFGLPESLIPRRLPIGTEEIIKNAPKERFSSFYKKWYTPDRMVVVAVGNIKPEEMAKAITEKFSDLKPGAARIPDPDLGKVSSGHGLVAKLHTEKEAGYVSISIDVARPYTRRPDNSATRYDEFVHGLADELLDRRFSTLAKKEKSPIISASSTTKSAFMEFVESSSIGITCKPENWEQALALGAAELRRAITHGFLPAELAEARSNYLADLENDAQQASTRESRALASDLVSEIANRTVFTHPKDDLARLRPALEKVTLKECQDALARAWKTEDIRIFVGGNLTLEKPEEKIKTVYSESLRTKLDPWVDEASGDFAYTDFGPAGKVASTEEVKDLGITKIVFENNVRLNLKPTDFKKDAIEIQVSFGGGRLTLPADKPGLMLVAGSIFDAGGLEKHSMDDLKRLLAGKTVYSDFVVGDDFFILSGKTIPKDLTLEFQLLCASMTAPGYRDEALRQLHQSIDSIYSQVDHTPEGQIQAKLDEFLHGNDGRFKFPAKDALLVRSVEEVKAWLGPQLKESYVEIGVVGDFKKAEVIAAVAKTFGAIPKRADRLPYTEERKVAYPPAQEKVFTFETKLPKAVVGVFWPTTDRRSAIGLSRRCNMVAEILSDRVREKVREELGDSYSPDVHSQMSDAFTGYGGIGTYLIVEPDKAALIAKVVTELAATFADKGATPDELDRARKPMQTMVDQQLRTNKFWLSTITSVAQSEPVRLDWARTISSDYAAITIEEVNSIAAKYLKPERVIVTHIVPDGTEVKAESKKPKP